MKVNFGKFLVLGVCLLLLYSMKLDRPINGDCPVLHEEDLMLMSGADSLFEGFNGLFASSGKCDDCHGPDEAGIASVDFAGNDINLVNDWQASMMANSARDPFWRAKVSHEVSVNPGLQNEIEHTCTKCHAPLGHFDAVHDGAEFYSIAQMSEDSIALDGVSCLACHQRDSLNLDGHFSGELFFVEEQKAFGQYELPLVTPMALGSGYTPEYSAHIRDAAICAGCHTLITETVDMDGNFTGDHFVEQATYHEWLNSVYSENNITCQECHMPVVPKTDVVLAAGIPTPPRPFFALHEFAGANTLMLNLMKENKEQLGIVATDEMFDETIARTFDQLQQKSLDLELISTGRTADSVFFELKLINKAGHKLPSGYPARKISVQFTLLDDFGLPIFESGGFDNNYYISGENQPFEPHHNLIDNEDEVQVYEMIFTDVEGNKTTILNRGFETVKDNRLVPEGFTTTDEAYDTTMIVGDAVLDPNFNHDPSEGSGTDIIHYRVALNGYTDMLSASASVWYQSLPPTWMEEIFSASTPEIDFFESMFNDADQSPVLMNSESLEVPSFVSVDEPELQVPSVRPVSGGLLFNDSSNESVEVFDSSGKLVAATLIKTSSHFWPLKLATGSYTVVFSRNELTSAKKILVH